jgi:hypothetical protein
MPLYLLNAGNSDPFDLYTPSDELNDQEIHDLLYTPRRITDNLITSDARKFLLSWGDTPAKGLKAYLTDLITKKVDKKDVLNIKITPYEDDLKELSSNRFKEVSIFASNILLKNLNIKSLDFKIQDPLLDMASNKNKKRLTFIKAGEIKLKIIITEKDLTDFVNLKVKDKKDTITEPKIELKNNEVLFSGRAFWWIFKTRFEITGHFEVIDKTLIHFTFHNLKLSGSNAPGFIKKKLSEKLNPLADLSRFPGDFTLNKIDIFDDRIEIIH